MEILSGQDDARGEEPDAAPRIVDSHCHIASFDHLPRSFVDGSIDNAMALFTAQGLPLTRSRMWELYDAKMQDHLCDELVGEMDQAGISAAVLLIADFTCGLKDCQLTIEESFERHAQVMRRHPGRFEVFGGVDPRWGRDGLELFERAVVEDGFSGFKVYPPCGVSPSDRAFWPFYDLCSQHGLPVVVHIGPTSPIMSFDLTNPFLIDGAALAFPTVNFILAHGSVSFRDECRMLCRYRPNVYLDVSGFQMRNGSGPLPNALRDTVSQGINHKVLFGTDWPVFRLGGTQHNIVRSMLGADGSLAALNDVDRALILSGNLKRLMPATTRQAIRSV